MICPHASSAVGFAAADAVVNTHIERAAKAVQMRIGRSYSLSLADHHLYFVRRDPSLGELERDVAMHCAPVRLARDARYSGRVDVQRAVLAPLPAALAAASQTPVHVSRDHRQRALARV